MKSVLIHLNFYILTAMDQGANDTLSAEYFNGRLSLESFEYYWQNQRDAILKIPEWSRLKGWNELLGQILESPHPPLFNVIMLFESLTIPPLDKCLDRDSRAFARRVIARPEVQQYKNQYFHKKISPLDETRPLPLDRVVQ